MPKKTLIILGIVSLFSALLLACASNTTVSDPIDSSTSRPTLAPTPEPTLTFDEQKALANQIPYNDLFRNNETHIGKQVWYQGQVVQVIAEGNDKYQLRANVTRGEYGWDGTVFLHYSGKRILEDDIIEFIGTVEELLNYEAIFGQNITVPAIRVIASKLVAESGGAIPLTEPTELPTISAMLATPTVPPPTSTPVSEIVEATPIPTVESSPAPTAFVVSKPAQAPMPTPTPIFTPRPTQTPLPPGLSLEMPVAPSGILKGVNGIELIVTGITEDAWPAVQAANQFNDPPEEGNRYYMVTVAVAYPAGSVSVNISESDFKLIGDKRLVYEPYDHSCGVIPDELSGELFAGGRTEGNICFQIPSDESGLILIYQPGFGSEERRFLSLDPGLVRSANTLNVKLPEPDPTTLALPQGVALGNPIAPSGILKGVNGIELIVTGITEDAWPAVQAANQFNDPPEEGNRYYMVTVAVAYPAGSVSVNISESDFKLIGDKRLVYEPYDHSCGVIPDELSGELFAGGRTEGNICFQIPSDESGLILIYQPGFGSEERRFLSLDPGLVVERH